MYTIDTVISLGKYRSESYKSTSIYIDDGYDSSSQVEGDRTKEDRMDPSKKELTIIQTYTGGTICETTGKPRKAKVNLKCCTEQQTKILLEQQRQQQLFSSSPISSEKILILKVDEDKNNICTYVADACTPLLCRDVHHDDNNNDVFEPSPWLQQQSSPSFRGSIRLILQSALEGLCLQRADGWWRYEICHKKHTRQFHLETVVDSATGVAVAKVETDHLLGLYLDEAITNNKASVNRMNEDEVELNYMEQKGTSDAAYVVEYANGDLCDNSPEDIKDHGLKTVARSTTVKYSCGKNYELARIEEDRTCHYVFHVTIPDLCRHPWFHIPVLKEQVIKCLPVPSDLS
jgi:hypothetical protein